MQVDFEIILEIQADNYKGQEGLLLTEGFLTPRLLLAMSVSIERKKMV
jgi:hypothetical protein